MTLTITLSRRWLVPLALVLITVVLSAQQAVQFATPQHVIVDSAAAIAGTVTANAGTNLNTSALALEAGGHLATVDTSTAAASTTLGATNGAAVVTDANGTVQQYLRGLIKGLAAGTWQVVLGTSAAVIGHVIVDTAPSTAVTNAGTFAVQSTNQTQTDTVMIGGVNVKEINAVPPLMGNGAAGTGGLRVSIASDSTGVVQPGNTPNTTPWITAHWPDGSSSGSPSNVVSTALEASHVVKNAAGTLYLLTCLNTKTSTQYLQIFNSTTVPADATATTTAPMVCAATSNCSVSYGVYGRYFATGIAWSNSSTATTKTIGSADMWCDAQVK